MNSSTPKQLIELFAAEHPTAEFTSDEIAQWAILGGHHPGPRASLRSSIERSLGRMKYVDPEGRRITRFFKLPKGATR